MLITTSNKIKAIIMPLLNFTTFKLTNPLNNSLVIDKTTNLEAKYRVTDKDDLYDQIKDLGVLANVRK